MKYLSLQYCFENIFPFIHAFLTRDEAAPSYQNEEIGMKELNKILTFVQNDEYYPDFYYKAAYLVCSIAGAQHFSNGNKRLGVGVLIAFLSENNATTFSATQEELKKIFLDFFPEAIWENNKSIGDGHALFLYNLAIVVGDPQRRNASTFEELKLHVMNLFAFLYKIQ